MILRRGVYFQEGCGNYMQSRYTGDFVQRNRKRLGLSLRQLAQQAQCSHSAIDKIERGVFLPCDDLAVTLAVLLGTVEGHMLYLTRNDRADWGREYRLVTR